MKDKSFIIAASVSAYIRTVFFPSNNMAFFSSVSESLAWLHLYPISNEIIINFIRKYYTFCRFPSP